MGSVKPTSILAIDVPGKLEGLDSSTIKGTLQVEDSLLIHLDGIALGKQALITPPAQETPHTLGLMVMVYMKPPIPLRGVFADRTDTLLLSQHQVILVRSNTIFRSKSSFARYHCIPFSMRLPPPFSLGLQRLLIDLVVEFPITFRTEPFPHTGTVMATNRRNCSRQALDSCPRTSHAPARSRMTSNEMVRPDDDRLPTRTSTFPHYWSIGPADSSHYRQELEYLTCEIDKGGHTP